MKSSFKSIIAVFLFSFLGVLMFADGAGAITRIGPDPASHANNTPRYTLERKPEVTVTDIYIPVYLPSRPTSCVSVSIIDFKYPFAGTSAWQGASNHIRASINGIGFTGNTSRCISASSFSYDSQTGYYKTILHANGRGGVYNWANAVAFRLRVDYYGGLIGISGGRKYSTASGPYFNNSLSVFENYSIKFATPCNVTSSIRQNIVLEDLDSGTSAGNRGRPITVRVYDETSGRHISLGFTGSTGDGGVARYSMVFEPNHRYRLEVGSVWVNNTLIYTFPYDNINYALNCSWSASATSGIKIGSGSTYSTSRSPKSPLTVSPGQTIGFQHTVRNKGPWKTSAVVNGTSLNSTYLNGSSVAANPNPNPDHSSRTRPVSISYLTLEAASGSSSSRTSSTVVSSSWVSDTKVYCQNIKVTPGGSGGGDVYSDPACYKVPYKYTLSPSLDSGSVPSRVTPSNTVSPTGSVSNDGPTKSKDDTIWQLTKFVVKSGGPVASAPVNDNLAPCGTSGPRAGNKYGAVNSSCWDIGSGGGAISPEASRSVVSGPTSVPGDLAVGDKLCFVLSARDRSHNPGSTRWRHSAPRCAVVAKSPKVDVLGGDLWTRGGVTTSTSQGSDASSKFGSSSEYATAANNLVNGLSSQLKFKKLPPVSQAAGMCTFSDLTLGNATSTTSGSTTSFNCADNAIGRYTILPAMNRASTQLASSSGASALGAGNISIDDLNSLDSKTYTKASGNITIGRSDISAGKQVIISAANSDVYINDDITYTTDELNSISQIPQVVIIARNIYISQNTSQVDSWLVAAPTGTTNGYLNTCYLGVYANRNDLVSGLHAEVCDRPLTVNGPVTAKKLLLRRTAGSNNYGRDEQLISGETFNLRPDAYLWLYNRNSASAGIPTTLTKELPPRY